MKKKERSFVDFIRPKRLNFIVSVLLAICSVGCSIIPYLAVYKLLNSLVEQGTLHDVFVSCMVIVGSLVLELVFHYSSTIISHVTTFSILEKIRTAVTEKMMRMPLGDTRAKGSGYFKNLVIDQIERLEYPLAHAMPETTSSVLTPVAAIALLFSVDWRMALAVVIPAIITLLCYLPMYLGIMNEFTNTYYHALNRMNSKVIEYITGIREIKIFGKASDLYEQYESSIDEFKSATLKMYNKMYFVTAPAYVLLSSLLVGILVVGGVLYCNGSLPFQTYLFSIIMSLGIGTKLLKFTEFMDNFFGIKNGKRMVNEILSAAELPENNDAVMIPGNTGITFTNVSFAYDKKTVLHDISLHFPSNKKTALVGPSGAGKTTIANITARYWDVTQGSVTLGGIDYRNIPLESLMKQVTYVTQDTFLFNMSIKENIRIGKPDANEDEIVAAARAACCEEFISTLADGYDTLAGDAGAQLSGGQRQRIVIARAILRDAPILILDEATAYTDMENQQKIQAALNELCRNKTLIIIAHRLSTVCNCDQIIVMNNGTIEAIGSHEQLLTTSALYQKLWAFEKEQI